MPRSLRAQSPPLAAMSGGGGVLARQSGVSSSSRGSALGSRDTVKSNDGGGSSVLQVFPSWMRCNPHTDIKQGTGARVRVWCGLRVRAWRVVAVVVPVVGVLRARVGCAHTQLAHMGLGTCPPRPAKRRVTWTRRGSDWKGRGGAAQKRVEKRRRRLRGALRCTIARGRGLVGTR